MFSGEESLVIMNTKTCIKPEGERLHRRYRQTFLDPRFNPRWKQGTAEFIEVIDF